MVLHHHHPTGVTTAPIDARISRFGIGYLPVDEMHFISTLQRARIRMVVNYFSLVSFSVSRALREDFQDERFADPVKRETI